MMKLLTAIFILGSSIATYILVLFGGILVLHDYGFAAYGLFTLAGMATVLYVLKTGINKLLEA